MEYIHPFSFNSMLRDKYKIINNSLFIQITKDIVPNIRQGQYINDQGIVFDEVTQVFRVPFPSSCGRGGGEYYRINLADFDGKYFNTFVHRLIMMTFSPADNMQNLVVNHIDGNKLNNNLLNLEWTTVGGNNKHAYRTGLRTVGEEHHMAKLTEKEVEAICIELQNPRYKGQFKEIGLKYNISSTDISAIASGKIWRKTSEKYNIDYNIHGTTSKLTDDEVREICKDLEHPYPQQISILAEKYGVTESMIKLIRSGKYHADIVKDYNISLPKPRQYFTEDMVHKICKIIEEHGCWNDDTYTDIINQLGLDPSTNMRMRLKKIYNKDPKNFYNITSQYKW